MKNKNIKIAILVVVFLIGIGYAGVTALLTVDGSTSVKGNQSNFDTNLTFDAVRVSTGASYTLSSNKREITFTTAELTDVNQSSTVYYKIKNGSIYGASVSKISCESSDTSYATYLEVKPSRTANLTVNKSSTSSEESVTVKLIKLYPSETVKTISFTCTMNATATSA